MKSVSAAEAASLIKNALSQEAAQSRAFTVADASVASGVSLDDADRGLHALSKEYRGRLRVSEKGELLFRFPTGFQKPWEQEETLTRIGKKIFGAVEGLGRFLVRAWLMIVLVGYAVVFTVIGIGLALAARDESSGIGDLIGGIFRVLAEALYWTFNPFSSFSYGSYGYGYGSTGYYGASSMSSGAAPWEQAATQLHGQPPEAPEEKVPFYARIDRFVFGPKTPELPEFALEQQVVAEIRRQKGRVGLSDVMRVTGLSRDKVDPLMSGLMLHFEGDVEVSNAGGIFYSFPKLRPTAGAQGFSDRYAAPPNYAPYQKAEPLTGNGWGSNILIGGLNAFNLMMSWVALSNHWTLHNLGAMFRATREHPAVLTPGTPMVLGLVPFIFSLALFIVPALRFARSFSKAKQVASENGRLALLWEVLSSVRNKGKITMGSLSAAMAKITGQAPTEAEIQKRVVELGGDAEIAENGQLRFRFVDLELEAEALERERAQAPEEEARVGKIVFDA
jgi:hypothetical protein